MAIANECDPRVESMSLSDVAQRDENESRLLREKSSRQPSCAPIFVRMTKAPQSSTRISSTAFFARLFRYGRRFFDPLLMIVWLPEGTSEDAGLGLSIGRKVGSAVLRNRIKRRMRHAYTATREKQPFPLSLLLVARPSSRKAGYTELLNLLTRFYESLTPEGQQR